MVQCFGIAAVHRADEHDAGRAGIFRGLIIGRVGRHPGHLRVRKAPLHFRKFIGRDEEDEVTARQPADLGFKAGLVEVDHLAAFPEALGAVREEIVHQAGVDRA